MSDDTVILGAQPARLIVRLVTGAPFVSVLTSDTAWAAAPTLNFTTAAGPLSWTSTLSEDNVQASFGITATDVDALVAAGPTGVRLSVAGVPFALGGRNAVVVSS